MQNVLVIKTDKYKVIVDISASPGEPLSTCMCHWHHSSLLGRLQANMTTTTKHTVHLQQSANSYQI